MGRLQERKIIATLAAFIGGGWFTYEVVHWILVDHYHLPNILKDIAIVSFLGALLSTVIWRWFRGAEKRPGKVKVEVLVVPLIILLTLVIDLKFIFTMTGISINMLLIGIVALCLGIAWVVFKSLQWAASTPEAEKKVEVLKPIKGKQISFPEWKKSIVVLPFENISPEEGQDYFCDGMTEEIITDLSKIHSLRVISRGSAMTLKGTKRKANEIAEELKVQYVLEGSVRKAGNDIRITAQLIDATSDAHLWADKYSGALNDVFDIQEKVSLSIVDALKLKLTTEEDKKISERPVENIHAYDCYLQARRDIWICTEDSLARAHQQLKNGLDLVGDNPLLYSGLGYLYLQYIVLGLKPRDECFIRAEGYIKKIFELEPESIHGHRLLGLIQYHRGNMQAVVKHMQKVLVVDPNDPDALHYLPHVYCIIGKTRIADPLVKRLVEIDPLTPMNHWGTAWLPWMEGHFDQALKVFKKVYQLNPKNPVFQYYYAMVHAYNQELEEAYSVIDQSVKDSPKNYLNSAMLFLKYALKGKKSDAINALTPEFTDLATNNEEGSYWMAVCYALLDEKDKSLDWLENAIDRGFINYKFFNEHDPFLEKIRKEPRFRQLMDRVKYEAENFEI